MNAATDEQLLSQYVEGRKEAFRRLVERYHRALFEFVLRFTGSRAAAEDIVQDTFIQVHLSAESFDPSRKFKPWLFTIAANKARDHLRSRNRRKEVPLDAPIDGDQNSSGRRFFELMESDLAGPLDNLEEAEKTELVRGAVEQMPDNLREILLLAYFNQFAYKEMAEMLDIPIGTVKSRLHSAVASFGQIIRQQMNLREGQDV